MIAAHRIEDQPLVGFQHIADLAGVVHRELQAVLVEPHARARPLAVERQRSARRVGEVEGQVIRARARRCRSPPGNMLFGGSRKAIEMMRWPSAMRLPVRR